MHGEPMWLRASVGEHLGQTCAEANFSPALEPRKLAQTIYQSYSTADHRHLRAEVIDLMTAHVQPGGAFLDGCLGIIVDVLRLVDLPVPRLARGSHLCRTLNDPTERLIVFSNALADRRLLVGNGSFRTVHDVDRLIAADVEVVESQYLSHHPRYPQARRRRMPFIPGLSVIDALLNVGKHETAQYLNLEGERHASN